MKKYTQEFIQNIALQYNTIKEFRINNKLAYSAASRMRILDDICAHMSSKYKQWSYTDLHNEALKYNTKNEFYTNNKSAYKSATHRNILKDICSHMTQTLTFWDEDMLQIEALKYNFRIEFRKANYGAYGVARDRGILNKICSHMEFQNNIWTDDMIVAEALKYNTRNLFQQNSPNGYRVAHRRNLLDDVCSHMTRMGGFNPKSSGYLYYIRFESELNLPIYKIGITNNEDISIRLKSMGVSKEYTPTVICKYYYDDGYECIEAEKLYHKEFERFKYLGDNILHDGNTELFCEDVLGVDNE
jgi:hypothetical protein